MITITVLALAIILVFPVMALSHRTNKSRSKSSNLLPGIEFSFLKSGEDTMAKIIAKTMILSLIFISLFHSAPLLAHKIPEYIEPPEMKRLFKPGDNAPRFTLLNHKGRDVSLEGWRGKVVLLSFIDAECSDLLCPVLMTKYINIQIDLEKEDKLEKEIILAAITVEPSHDTPDLLNRYVEDYRMYPYGVHLLSGKPEIVKEILKDYGVLAVKEELEFHFHHSLTLLIGKDGVIKYAVSE